MHRSLFPLPLAAFVLVVAQPVAAQQAAVTVGHIVITGAHSVPATALVETATRSIQGKSGDPVALRAAAEAVKAEYQRRGFPVAQVLSTEVAPDGTLTITVAEGTVRHIVVRGNRKTRASTVLAAMQTHPGDVYQEDRITEDRNSLSRLGIFDEVTVAPELLENAPATDATPAKSAEDTLGLVDLVVRVRERRTGNVAATLGYGQNSGLIGYLDLSENNFAGEAQRVAAQWQRWTNSYYDNNNNLQTDSRSAYTVSYFAPFFGRGRTAVGLDLYQKNTIFQPIFSGNDDTVRNYERRHGARGRIGRQLNNRLAVFLTARRDEVGYDLSRACLAGGLFLRVPRWSGMWGIWWGVR